MANKIKPKRKGENKVARSSKNKVNKKIKKNSKIKQNIIQVIILSLIICAIIFFVCTIINLIKNPTQSFLIETGEISKKESTIGYIIRDEVVIQGTGEQETKLVQIKNEGEKVAVGEKIFRYEAPNEAEINNQINQINEELQKAMEGQEQSLPTDINALNNQIEDKIIDLQDKNNIQEIAEYKSDINSYIAKKAKISGELSPVGSYIKSLINQKTNLQNELYNNSKCEVSEMSGIISYRVDGLEEILKPTNFNNITPEYLEGLNLVTGQIVTTSENTAKITNNFEAYIAIISTSKEAEEAVVGDKVSIRLSTNKKIKAEIAYKNEQSEKKIIIFKITEGVEYLTSYRKVSLDIIWWEEEGLKTPNTSIIYENGLSYVIRKKSDIYNKILVKIVEENEKYSIITNYKTEELKNMGYSMEEIISMKKISIYDEILADPELDKIDKQLN